jgi:hypothetical protein
MTAEGSAVLGSITKQQPAKTQQTEKAQCVPQWIITFADLWNCYNYM